MNIYLINCFDTYEHRIELLYKVLKEEGNNVNVITSNFRHFEKKVRTDIKEDYYFIDVEPYYRNLSYRRIHSHVKFSKDVLSYLESKKNSIDLLWVLVPPNSLVKDLVRLKEENINIKLIFDLIDLWPETLPINFFKHFFPFNIWKNLRDKNISKADYVVTECSMYQEKLKKLLENKKTQTLFLARPKLPYKSRVRLSSDTIGLCYLGSINNIIDINEIALIVEEFRKRKSVVLHIVGDGENREALIKSVEKKGAKVKYHGKVFDRETKQEIFDSCHYGLNIMKKSVCVGLTMKSMDYLEFGLPMINSIKGDTWDFIVKRNIGINIDQVVQKADEEYDMQMRNNARLFFEEYLTDTVFSQNVKSIIAEI